MNKELNGLYLKDFNRIKRHIVRRCKSGTERDEALQNLRDIYLDAQERGTALEEIRGESAEEYAREIAKSLAQRGPIQWKRAAKPLACLLIAAGICLFAVSALLHFTSDSYAIQSKGLSFLNANPQKFVPGEQESSYAAFYSNGNSSFASHFCFNDDGSVTHGGYANNYGVFFENIVFNESYEAFSLDVRVRVTSWGDGVYELNTPVKPVFDSESGELLYFIKSPVTARAGDCGYTGAVSGCYVDSAGCVRFHIDFALDSPGGNTDPAEHVTGGKAVDVFFERVFTLKWRRARTQTEAVDLGNLKTFPEQHPVYDTEHAVYTTKDGCITVVMDIVFDPDAQRYIEIAGNELIRSDLNVNAIYDDPSYSYIDESGAVHRRFGYTLKNGEKRRDEAVFVYEKQ